MIENTTYSGEGKPVYEHFVPSNNTQLVDWKGRSIVPHEEYCYFGEGPDKYVLVALDDAELYLFGEYGMFASLNNLIDYLDHKYGILPEIIIK